MRDPSGPRALTQERPTVEVAIGILAALGLMVIYDHEYKPRD